MFTVKEQLLEKRNGPDERRTSEGLASQHQHQNLKHQPNPQPEQLSAHRLGILVLWVALLLAGVLLFPMVSSRLL